MLKKFLINFYNEKIFPFLRYKKFRMKNCFTVMNFKKTINFIKKNHCSIARFGDGEFGIIMKSNNPDFQEYDDLLAEKLKKVARCKEKNLLICIPYTFVSTKNCDEFAREFWNWWLWDKQNLYHVGKILELNPWRRKKYGNAQITRPYMDFLDKRKSKQKFELLKSLWDKREILIVEGYNTRLGVGNDLFSNVSDLQRIICPSKNAFAKYDKILETVKKYSQNKLVLIALGPTATILAYDLSKYNIQALDIGHVDIEYEWFLRKAKRKEAIEGKEVQEIHFIEANYSIKDQSYLSEIVSYIK